MSDYMLVIRWQTLTHQPVIRVITNHVHLLCNHRAHVVIDRSGCVDHFLRSSDDLTVATG